MSIAEVNALGGEGPKLLIPSPFMGEGPGVRVFSPLPLGEGQGEGNIVGADLGVRPNFIEWMECHLLQRVRTCRMNLFHFIPEGDPRE